MKPTIVFGLLKASNILSFGSGGFEIDLSSHQMTLIEGKNGHGKSTILEALTYCLFGKPYRKIRLGQLINSKNGKGLLTTLAFRCSSDEYLIKRGQKPSIFEIWKNGELIPEDSASGDYQKFLESKILGFSYKTFKQVCVIGSASYSQFMTLTAEQRRSLIEDLLDVNIYSKMSTKAKEELSTLKKQVDLIGVSSDQKKSELSRLEKVLAEMKASEERKKNDLSKVIEESNAKIEKLESDRSKLSKEVEELCSKIANIESLKSSVGQKSHQVGSFGESIKKLEKHLAFFDENSICPTCTQEIQESHTDSIRTRTKAEIAEIKKEALSVFNSLKTDKVELQSLQDISSQIPPKNREIAEINSKISALRATIDGVNREMNSTSDSSKVSDQIDAVQKESVELFEKKSKLQEDFSYLQEIVGMLKDSGIKACTIKEYIPLINSTLNQHLESFGLFVNFMLDENFEEKILSRDRDDFSYFSFSEGEKQRIDLSILFTWREISRRKNSVSCNILFFDETLDSSLDADSIQSFLELIRSKEDVNTFVISHRGTDQTYFDQVIKVYKKSDDYSRIKFE